MDLDPAKLREMASKLTEEQRRELAEKMDKDLDKYMESLEGKSSKYMDGWSQENWEQEMEQHPFFTSQIDGSQELSPLLQGIQDLKYSPDENTPEELAKNYKEDGNFNFKCGKYRFAVASYSEGLKHRCSDELLNTQLLSNRAAAQFRIGNHRSALIDCRLALSKTPGHRKALVKGAQCCLQLKRYQECVDLCDVGLTADAKDEELLELRAKATKGEAEEKRNARREAAMLKKKQTEESKILSAIEKKGITIMQGKGKYLELEDLEPTHPAALRKRVHFVDGSGDLLVWPVLFLYPEHGETDFIEEFVEDQTFADHLEAMFGAGAEPAPWDAERKYQSGRIKLYFEDNTSASMPRLVQVDTGKTLGDLLGDKRYQVKGGTPGFVALADNTDFQRDFVQKYKQ